MQEERDENVGSEALETAEKTAKRATYAGKISYKVGRYSKKRRNFRQASKFQEKNEGKKTSFTQKKPDDGPEAEKVSLQKRRIKKEYQTLKRNEDAASYAAASARSGITTLKGRITKWTDQAFTFVRQKPQVVIMLLIPVFLLLIVSSSMSSCAVFFPGGSGAITATIYLAEDTEILGANEDYKALEAGLQAKIDGIEEQYPGFDEYCYDLDEIGHDPFQLTSFLTVLYEDYTREQVQDTLLFLFSNQYELKTEETIEVREKTETRTGTRIVTFPVVDPETGKVVEMQKEEEYEYEEIVSYEAKILTVTLTNRNLAFIIAEDGGLSEEELSRYAVLNQTRGNRPYLFADDPYVSSADILVYDIPGEALSDVRFANMVREAEKYLGYPYVWGGESPATSFDCSGFVSYVINHCGNGWDFGRLTANGLTKICKIIPASEAKPGDLIFFQGTYNTSGASHVGIYVGDGMMIHCGNPIQYASIESSYWQRHFYCFGRLP